MEGSDGRRLGIIPTFLRRRGAYVRNEDRRRGRLPVVPFYDEMWFAWYAFFPETHVATA